MILIQKHRKDVRIYDTEVCTTLTEGFGMGGGNIPMVITAIGIDRYNQSTTEEVSPTLKEPVGGDSLMCVLVEEDDEHNDDIQTV